MKLFKWLSCNWLFMLLSAVFYSSLFHAPKDSSVHYAVIGGLGAYACRSLQAKLGEFFGKNIALYRTLGSTSLIKWLLSPQNTRGFRRIDVESIPGKKRGVAFRVDLPYCFSLCAIAKDCYTQDVVYLDTTSQEMVFDLTTDPFRHCDANGKPVILRFKEADLEKFCTETDMSYVTDKISQYLLEWEMALDKALTTILNTAIGTDINGNAVVDLPIFVKGNTVTPGVSALNPDSIWYMDQLLKDIGLEGQYAMMGGTIVSKIASHMKWTTANGAGVDLSKWDSGLNIPFYDRNFNTTFGQSDLILMPPGVNQLVTWNRYKGEKARAVTNLYSKGTVVLPTTGLEVDWVYEYDYKCEEWTFEAFLYGELATVPAGGCVANAATVNGNLRISDCGVVDLVPACPAP